MNVNIKKWFSIFWEVVVVIAYIKFYLMCLVTFTLVLVLSIFVISEAGGDVTRLGDASRYAVLIAFFWVVIITIDKFNNFRKESSLLEDKKND